MKKIHICIIVLVLSAISVGCKSKNDDPSSPSATPNGNGDDVVTAPLSLHLHAYISETEVDGVFIYRNSDGRKIRLDTAQVYLSSIELVKFDGSIYQVKDVVILAKIGQEVYPIGAVPVGNYKSIRFQAGVTQADNAKVPSGNNVLNDKTMLFGGSATANNHVFVYCSGLIDTTAAKNAADDKMVDFRYKIGTNNQLKNVVMAEQKYAVAPNNTSFVHMYIDYAKLFSGVDLVNNVNLKVSTASDNEWPIATKVAANIPSMFKYENE